MTESLHQDATPPTPSLLDAVIPVVALVVLLSLSFMLYGERASAGPNQVALLFCGIIAAAVAYKNGLALGWRVLRAVQVTR